MQRRRFLSRASGGLAGATLLGGCIRQGEPRTTPSPDGEPAQSGSTATPAVELDGDFRTVRRERGTSVADFEDRGVWSQSRGSVSLRTDERGPGETGLELATDEGTTEAIATRAFERPRDFSNNAFSLGVKWETPRDGWYQIALTLADATGDYVRFTQIVETQHLNDWHRFDLGVHSVSGDPDLGATTRMDLMTWVGGKRSRVVVDDLRATRTPDTGYVMFTFDDVRESVYTVARPAMREYGYAGCGGVIKEAVDKPGYLSLRQMDELAATGWEFCSHPQYDHAPIPGMTLGRLRKTLAAYKRWLYDHGFGAGAEIIIYPYGLVDDAALDVVANYSKLGFKVERGQYGPTITSPLLLGRTDGDRPGAAKRAIDRAAEYGLVVPLMYHGLDTDGRVSRRQFEATLDYVANEERIEVVTPGEYLSKLEAGKL